MPVSPAFTLNLHANSAQPASQPASQLYESSAFALDSYNKHTRPARLAQPILASGFEHPQADLIPPAQASLTAVSAQVVSKKRVADHGEVYTHPREVNAMLDLVLHETQRIESRFLEPACGTGNFLVEILARKLAVVESRYKSSQLEYERYAVLAAASIYGIDILADNVAACRARLLGVFNAAYTRLFKAACKPACCRSVACVLGCNILHGDALTLKTVDLFGHPTKPIVFAEWNAVNGSLIKRRDFVYGDLVDKASERELPLFSDLGDEAFIPEPHKDYPLVHFLELGNE
jgi:SAM-dependent methyltransferase